MMIVTERLRLVPCTLDLARASPGSAAVKEQLGVEAAEGWPEEPVREFLPVYAGMLEADPDLLGWGIWLIVHRTDARIIGDVGFKGKPDPDGDVEIGYSVVPSYRGHGHATEAARALVEWAFQQPGVTRIVAECDRDNVPSIRVLTKVGMTQVGEEGDLLRWETDREAWQLHGQLQPG